MGKKKSKKHTSHKNRKNNKNPRNTSNKKTVQNKKVKNSTNLKDNKELTATIAIDSSNKEDIKVTDTSNKETIQNEKVKNSTNLKNTNFKNKHTNAIKWSKSPKGKKATLILTTSLLTTIAIVPVCKFYFTHTKSNLSLQDNFKNTTSSELSSLSLVGKKIEESNLLNSQFIYSVDPEFDYRFSDIFNFITDSYVISSGSNDFLQEVYIFKSPDNSIIHTALEKCKKSFELSSSLENKKLVENAVINSTGDYTYLIISKNASKIERRLLKELH